MAPEVLRPGNEAPPQETGGEDGSFARPPPPPSSPTSAQRAQQEDPKKQMLIIKLKPPRSSPPQHQQQRRVEKKSEGMEVTGTSPPQQRRQQKAERQRKGKDVVRHDEDADGQGPLPPRQVQRRSIPPPAMDREQKRMLQDETRKRKGKEVMRDEDDADKQLPVTPPPAKRRRMPLTPPPAVGLERERLSQEEQGKRKGKEVMRDEDDAREPWLLPPWPVNRRSPRKRKGKEVMRPEDDAGKEGWLSPRLVQRRPQPLTPPPVAGRERGRLMQKEQRKRKGKEVRRPEDDTDKQGRLSPRPVQRRPQPQTPRPAARREHGRVMQEEKRKGTEVMRPEDDADEQRSLPPQSMQRRLLFPTPPPPADRNRTRLQQEEERKRKGKEVMMPKKSSSSASTTKPDAESYEARRFPPPRPPVQRRQLPVAPPPAAATRKQEHLLPLKKRSIPGHKPAVGECGAAGAASAAPPDEERLIRVTIKAPKPADTSHFAKTIDGMKVEYNFIEDYVDSDEEDFEEVPRNDEEETVFAGSKESANEAFGRPVTGEQGSQRCEGLDEWRGDGCGDDEEWPEDPMSPSRMPQVAAREARKVVADALSGRRRSGNGRFASVEEEALFVDKVNREWWERMREHGVITAEPDEAGRVRILRLENLNKNGQKSGGGRDEENR